MNGETFEGLGQKEQNERGMITAISNSLNRRARCQNHITPAKIPHLLNFTTSYRYHGSTPSSTARVHSRYKEKDNQW